MILLWGCEVAASKLRGVEQLAQQDRGSASHPAAVQPPGALHRNQQGCSEMGKKSIGRETTTTAATKLGNSSAFRQV